MLGTIIIIMILRVLPKNRLFSSQRRRRCCSVDGD